MIHDDEDYDPMLARREALQEGFDSLSPREKNEVRRGRASRAFRPRGEAAPTEWWKVPDPNGWEGPPDHPF